MLLKRKKLAVFAGTLYWLAYVSLARSNWADVTLEAPKSSPEPRQSIEQSLALDNRGSVQSSTIAPLVAAQSIAPTSIPISSLGSLVSTTTLTTTSSPQNPTSTSPQTLSQQQMEVIQQMSLSTNSQSAQILSHPQQSPQQAAQQQQSQLHQDQMMQFQTQILQTPQQQHQPQQQAAQLQTNSIQPAIHNGQVAMQMTRHGQQNPSPLSQPQPHPVQQATYSTQPAPSQANSYPSSSQHHPMSPLYLGHNPFIEILRPLSYADDNIVTLNLSHSHIYEIDSDAFVGQRFEHIDLSNNKLGLIHRRSFRIGPIHSRHNPYNPNANGSSKQASGAFPTRRPPPTHPNSVTIDFSHNPAIVALSGAFDHIDVPNCLLNFTNSTVELKFGAFKKYFKEHPGHMIDIESVDCCEQEWLLGYKHNFVARTHCDHDHNLVLSKFPQQAIIDSCIAYVTSGRHSMTMQGPSIIQQVVASPRTHTGSHVDNQTYLTYLILGGTAMILTSLSIYIIFYMFSLKAAFVCQMQNKS